MLDEVKVFLKYFEKAYQKRDINDLEEFMEIFFMKDESYMFGTSTQEIFPDYNMAKKCVKNDWLYWGLLSIHHDQVFTMLLGDDLLVHVPGSVEYTFQDQEEVDENFVELMQTLNDEANMEDVSHLSYQHHEMNYILDHYLSRRKNEKRTNQFPLSMTFFLKRKNDAYKIAALSFDVATLDDYPDVIIHSYTPYLEQFNHDKETLMKHGQKLNINPFELKLSDDFIFFDTNGDHFRDNNRLEQRLNQFEHIDLLDYALVHETKDYKSFMTIGKCLMKQNERTLRQALKKRISDILKSQIGHESKLFKIRRLITLTDKMIALGDQVIYPIKVMGVITKKEHSNQLTMLKISYPMDIILEDKYI